MKKGKTVLIIPAFNEKGYIQNVLKPATEWEREKQEERTVVVINDGSRDDTEKIAKAHRVTVLQSDPSGKNVGKTKAVLTGVNYAKKKGAKFLLFFDADAIKVSKEHFVDMERQIKNTKKHMLVFPSHEKAPSWSSEGFELRDISGLRALRLEALTPLLRGNPKWTKALEAGYSLETALNRLVPKDKWGFSELYVDRKPSPPVMAPPFKMLVSRKQLEDVELTQAHFALRDKIAEKLRKLKKENPTRFREVLKRFRRRYG